MRQCEIVADARSYGATWEVNCYAIPDWVCAAKFCNIARLNKSDVCFSTWPEAFASTTDQHLIVPGRLWLPSTCIETYEDSIREHTFRKGDRLVFSIGFTPVVRR
jgi:hypothetical protein